MTQNKSDAELIQKLTIRCESRAKGLEEAWRIINVLHMDAMDRGESWPRALEWLSLWGDFAPDNKPLS